MHAPTPMDATSAGTSPAGTSPAGTSPAGSGADAHGGEAHGGEAHGGEAHGGEAHGGGGRQERRRTGMAVRVVGVLLLLLFAGLATDSMRRKSVTVDEMVYITAGYYHWKTGRFDFNATNPPLMKLLSALPLLALDPDLPPIDGDPGAWREIAQWHYAREFLYGNVVDADRILFWARLPTVLLGVLLGCFVWRFGHSHYGARAGLLALFFFSLSPNILAHGRLATQDLALTAGLFLTVCAFWRFLQRPSWGRQIRFGLLFGAAVATKTTALFFGPILLLCAALVLWRRDEIGVWSGQRLVARIPEARRVWRKLVSVAIAFVVTVPIVLLVLNVAYMFDGTFGSLSAVFDPARISAEIGGRDGVSGALMKFVAGVPLPVPGAFLRLVEFQASRVAAGNSLYFMGELSRTGWYTLMPFAFLVKTPLPTLLLLAVSLLGSWRWGRTHTVEWILVLSAGFVMALFCYFKSVNVGLRYVLPMYPFVFLLIGRLARDGGLLDTAGARMQKGLRVGAVVLLGWYAAGTFWLHPHYLAHFNELVGGPKHGYRYLADSFLDWGQDLHGLKDYMDRRNIRKIRLAYFGSADARYYGIDYDYLPSVGLAPKGEGSRWWYEIRPGELPAFDLADGRVAISATLLAGVFFPGYYEELQGLEPVDMIGSSILIFEPVQK